MLSARSRLAVASPVIATLAMTGCGAAPRSPGSALAPLALHERHYPPFAFAGDARTPTVAVFLATGGPGVATLVPLLAAARAVTLEADGDAATVRLASLPAADGRGTVRASLAVTERGDRAAGWRAAAWTAALAAAAALGKDPGDIAVTVDGRGAFDADAAAALLACGLLASRLGTAINPDATVTGVVFPDGTLGPTAGTDAGADAALAAGTQRIGLPPGARRRPSAIDGPGSGRRRRQQIVEVGDLRGAFLVLTGQRLPAAQPVPESAMAIDHRDAADDALRWTTRLAPLWATMFEIDIAGGAPAPLVATARAARTAVLAAEDLRTRGHAGAARARLIEAWTLATAADTTWRALVAMSAGDPATARQRLAAIDGGPPARAAVVRTAASDVVTLDGALDGMAAVQRELVAASHRQRAHEGGIAARGALDRLVAGAAPSARVAGEDLVAVALPAALAAARAAAVGDSVLPTDRTSGPGYRPDHGALRQRVTVLRDAASAMADADGGGRSGSTSIRLALDAARGASASLDALAAAELAVHQAWVELALRVSLGVDRDLGPGRALAPTAARAVPRLLVLAERAARAHAASARAATGSIPLEARLAYIDARARRGSDATDWVAALELFWRSSAWSQLAVTLARATAPPTTVDAPPPRPGDVASARPPAL